MYILYFIITPSIEISYLLKVFVEIMYKFRNKKIYNVKYTCIFYINLFNFIFSLQI